MRTRCVLSVLITAFVLVPLACGGPAPATRFAVAVSVPPHAWLVERIAGPDVPVLTLVSPGESPASFQPPDYTVSQVKRSSVYFRIGVPFERGKWFAALGDGLRIVDLRDGIELRRMEAHHHEHEHEEEAGEPEDEGGEDPHTWLSLPRLRIQAKTIASVLAELDPERGDHYAANLAVVEREIDEAHAEIGRILEPFRGRRLFVFHPAWGYFCDEYGLLQTPIELEGKEPSDREMTELIEMARADRVKVVFVQAQITGRSAQAVADLVGAEVRRLDPLAGDVPENLKSAAREIVRSYE